MISWIVASHDPAIHEANLRASLGPPAEDQLITIWNAPSIAKAYNDGQDMATQPIRCYIHHDVQILDLARLREQIQWWCLTPGIGMVGVIGSPTPAIPWWEGSVRGAVADGRAGRLGTRLNGGECVYLDGLLLATAHRVDWDERYPGWHMYDHDACQQMLAAGWANWCLPDGADLVRHNTSSSFRVEDLPDWHANVDRFKAKWGIHG